MRTTLRGLSAGVLALSVAIMAPSATAFAAGVGTEPAPEVLATLKVTSTKVEVRKAGAEKFKGARDGASLREGDTIRTDATGTAEVDYGNDSYTRLDVNTTFTIKRLTEEQGSRQVQGSLEAGQAWHRAAAITESESFEQEGAGANATVLGTAFAVVCDAVDRCTFTAVVDNIQLTGKDGVVKLLTPLDQCESSDTTAGGEVRDLTGVLCGDVTKISPDDLPEWIYENLVKDRDELGIDDSGLLDGTFVVEDDGSVFFVPALPALPALPAPPPTTVPGPVRNVVAVAGNGFATVSFDPPLSDGGSPITGYTATATPGGGPLSVAAAPVSVSVSGPGSPIVVDPLVNGVSYTFTVIATNAIGGGPTSTPSNAVTPVGAPPVIDALPVNISDFGGDTTPGETAGPNVRIVAQDERSVTFMLQVTNPGGGTYWVVFTDLPAAAFGRILRGANPVTLGTRYDPAIDVFTFDPVQIEPLCSQISPTAFAQCFTNGISDEGPNANNAVPYPSTVTPGPVAGSVQWSDTFSFKAQNDQGGESAPVTVDLVAVDDICTSGAEGPRGPYAGEVPALPSTPGSDCLPPL